MIRHPLQHGIGQDHVEGSAAALPVGDILDVEADAGQSLPRRSDHVCGAVDAGDGGVREAPLEQLRGVAGAAADIHGIGDRSVRDVRKQIANRTGPLILELAVLCC
jgi:hypothetical protein